MTLRTERIIFSAQTCDTNINERIIIFENKVKHIVIRGFLKNAFIEDKSALNEVFPKLSSE